MLENFQSLILEAFLFEFCSFFFSFGSDTEALFVTLKKDISIIYYYNKFLSIYILFVMIPQHSNFVHNWYNREL